MYGFLKKKGRINIAGLDVAPPQVRWLFLMSSRPLNEDDYIHDTNIMSNSKLPSIMDFDVIYYFTYDTDDDNSLPQGNIKTIDIAIDKLEIEQTKSDEFSFTCDVGEKKYTFMASTRFIAEQWVEAIRCSNRTSNENRYSVTGKIQNISKIVTLFQLDRDSL